jgi:small subunit ribosomal protein S20
VANHPAALKRHRQSQRRRLHNRAVKTQLRHLVRAVRAAIATGDTAAATRTLVQASRALQKAASKGVIHRNAAFRRISRLSATVSRRPDG